MRKHSPTAADSQGFPSLITATDNRESKVLGNHEMVTCSSQQAGNEVLGSACFLISQNDMLKMSYQKQLIMLNDANVYMYTT